MSRVLTPYTECINDGGEYFDSDDDNNGYDPLPSPCTTPGGTRAKMPSLLNSSAEKQHMHTPSSATKYHGSNLGLGVALRSALRASSGNSSNRTSRRENGLGRLDSRRPSLQLDSLPVSAFAAPEAASTTNGEVGGDDDDDDDLGNLSARLLAASCSSSSKLTPFARFDDAILALGGGAGGCGTREWDSDDGDTPTVASFALALKQARRATPYPKSGTAYFADEDEEAHDLDDNDDGEESDGDGDAGAEGGQASSASSTSHHGLAQ